MEPAPSHAVNSGDQLSRICSAPFRKRKLHRAAAKRAGRQNKGDKGEVEERGRGTEGGWFIYFSLGAPSAAARERRRARKLAEAVSMTYWLFSRGRGVQRGLKVGVLVR
jgi:hypothetical protein